MNKREIHDAIMDYHWMIKLLIAKKAEMTGSSASFVGKYGIDASLPMGKGSTSDPVYQEFLRIERYEKNTEKIRYKVMMIQKHSKAITNIRDQLILDKLLDGKSLREIAYEMNMSLSAVNHRKNAIVNKIYASIQAEQMEQTKQMKQTEQTEQTERTKQKEKICS